MFATINIIMSAVDLWTDIKILEHFSKIHKMQYLFTEELFQDEIANIDDLLDWKDSYLELITYAHHLYIKYAVNIDARRFSHHENLTTAYFSLMKTLKYLSDRCEEQSN